MILKDYSGAKRFKRFKSIKITASPIFHLKDEIKTNKKALFKGFNFLIRKLEWRKFNYVFLI